MSKYTPHVWVIIRITIPDADGPIDKVMGGWYGGYTGSNSWRLNSGIKKIIETDTHYEIYGHSGSVYLCNKETERVSSLMAEIIAKMDEQATEAGGTVEIIPISLLEIEAPSG